MFVTCTVYMCDQVLIVAVVVTSAVRIVTQTLISAPLIITHLPSRRYASTIL